VSVHVTAPTISRYQHEYEPRGTARLVMQDRRSEILVSGPAGTGKSRACLEKIHAVCKKYPGVRALIVRKTLSSLGSTALATWRQWVVDQDLLTHEVVYYGGSSEEPPQYRYRNGSAVFIGGMDKATRIMSSEYDIVFVQEAIELTEEDWDSITTRLRNGRMPYQQIIADTNPDAPTHWLNVRCQIGKCVMYNSVHEENPRLYDEIRDPFTGEVSYVVTEAGREYMAKLDNLSGVRYQRLRLGLWVAAEGTIYEEWMPGVHHIDPFPIPDAWQRFWVVDFGFKNPFVLQCWAESPDGILYLYRELYHTGKTVADHARDIMAIVSEPIPGYVHPRDAQGNERQRYAHHGRRWIETRPRTLLADHDAEGRATLAREVGLTTRPADKDVIEGIDCVMERLRERADGKRGLYVFKNCTVKIDQDLVDQKRPTCTAAEYLVYIWDTGGGKKIKDQPLKENDHGMDCTRYLCRYRDPLNRSGIRSMG
jgi:PBSX family phage terminase large subunit